MDIKTVRVLPICRWRYIDGYDKWYEVSNYGKVLSWRKQGHIKNKRLQSPLVMKLLKHSAGYPIVSLLLNGKRKKRLVHQLVLESFVGPRPDGMEACHNDGDRTNNLVNNLRWASHKENCHDAIKHGRHPHGSKCNLSKHNESFIHRIVDMHKDGLTNSEIATMVDKTTSYVWGITTGRRWSRTTGISS